MTPQPMFVRFAALALALGVLLPAGAAHAFTVENKDASPYTVPEFNLDEQLKHFRKDGTDTASAGKYQFDGMFGKGSLEFGVRQQPYSSFGSGIGPSFGSSGVGPTRRDFDRVTAPPSAVDFSGR